MHDLIPLSALAVGQLAQVGLVLGQPDQVHRLGELGLRDGTRVEMVQQGSPCIIRLGGQKLCFRNDELIQVLVRPGTER
ncbi:MAG: ferrous iron transport protein A [Planctomycetes bacterium]|nr:ferrous iron transport protein A [Planctomycetota bacterium]